MPADGGRAPLGQTLRKTVPVALVALVAIAALAWWHATVERQDDLLALDASVRAVAQRVGPDAARFLEDDRTLDHAAFVARLDGRGAFRGFALYDAAGRLVTAGEMVRPLVAFLPGPATPLTDRTLVLPKVSGTTLRFVSHVLARRDGTALGSLVAVEDLGELAARDLSRAVRLGGEMLVLVLLLFGVFLAMTWLAYDRSLVRLVDWMRVVRSADAGVAPPADLPVAGLAREASRLAATLRAARSASVERSREAVASEEWTRERLRTHAIASVGTGQLVVASNREPYLDRHGEDGIETIVPAGGVVAALDPVLRAAGGTWVAHGSGDADRETADAAGRVMVPPHDPSYALQRLWLSEAEEQGYYYGFSNQGLWPLCHLTHERPVFRSDDWACYRAVNERFAAAILDEVGDGDGLVLLQDYHLALVPRLLKRERPDLRVGLFWHIPWPNPDVFRACPWRTELLEGMLGADLVGFHLQEFCNNFIDCADRMVEARIDRNHFAVASGGATTRIAPFPISVKAWDDREEAAEPPLLAELRARGELDRVQLAVGVDRIDYTKGIPERLDALEHLLRAHPECRGAITLVQIGAPSRTSIPRYARLVETVTARAAELNAAFATDEWQPVHLLVGAHPPAVVRAWLEVADLCLVTSLHDGMNLVAKEYVSARHGAPGVLILSEFTGAAAELTDAVTVNPYDARRTAEAIREAMQMPTAEREARMGRMARHVARHNVYRWAASLMTELAALEPSGRDGH